jgi:1,4-alpha-glucan branching enzyme
VTTIKTNEEKMPDKTVSKTGNKVRVTFRLPASIEASQIALVGDFNDWNSESHLMKQLKDGSYSLSLSLDAGKSYRYRFYLDGQRWENDWDADAYAPNEFGGDDSIVNL